MDRDGRSWNEYKRMLVDEGIFSSDFEELEARGVVPNATKVHINEVLTHFIKQMNKLLMIPNPVMNDKAVDFLTNFKNKGPTNCGLGKAGDAFDELIEQVQARNISGVHKACTKLVATYIEAKKCTDQYMEALKGKDARRASQGGVFSSVNVDKKGKRRVGTKK